MRIDRAPRAKKRISCEILLKDSRYSGIVLDVSATGLWIQTNAKFTQNDSEKPDDGVLTVKLSEPGSSREVTVRARVARKKTVPPQFLGLDHGGIGLAVLDPSSEFFDFVAEISPEQADAVALARAAQLEKTGGGDAAGLDEGAERDARMEKKRETPALRFRIHVVEATSGKKKSYLASCASEEEASRQVIEQLGGAWQILFIERV